MRRNRTIAARLKAGLQGLHRDDRGAIAVLVLLTIWCLVAILGLVWNTTEEAYRRERIQTAADAAAHAASTWVSRTLNTVDAQNMVISQDASTEVIWRAVPPTDQALMNHLNQELIAAQQMKTQQGLQQLIRRLATQLQNVATERQLLTDALTNVEAGIGANYADANEALRYLNQYRQAESAREWVYNTYVMGVPPVAGDPLAPPRPGPPGPGGLGLAQIIQQWQPPENEDAILDYIINFINTTEIPIVRAFEQRTAPATAQAIDQLMADHEATVYQNELAEAENLALTIEQQRQELAAFYQTDVTLATLKREAGSPGPAAVTAPLMPAAEALPVTGYTDSIRTAYPVEAAAANLSPVIDIDADQCPRESDGEQRSGAKCDHLASEHRVPVPDDLRAQYPTLRASYVVNASFPDGWGHIWAMPLEQYVHQRVNADMANLNTDFMAPLDNARTQDLARAIRTMLGMPNNGNITITDLPATLPDDRAEPNIPPIVPPNPVPPPRYDQINVMPALTAPANATAAFRRKWRLYNQHGGAYHGGGASLRSSIISYTAYFNRFTQAFAQDTWQTNVNVNSTVVLENLGRSKQFMVLSTYGLRPIPDWAKAGMFDSATATIENQIMTINIQQYRAGGGARPGEQQSAGLGRGHPGPADEERRAVRGLYRAGDEHCRRDSAADGALDRAAAGGGMGEPAVAV